MTAIDENRFARKVATTNASGCMLWCGAIEKNGYGSFKLNGKKVGAHRAALMLSGVQIPEGMDVCHKCDERRCVNVAHLFVGTRSENMLDAKIKGRLRTPPMRSKLEDMTDEFVASVYRKCGAVRRAAATLKVSPVRLLKRLRIIGVSRRVKKANS